MSYTGILSLEDICHYGKRCTDWSKKKWSLALYRKRDGAFNQLN